MNIELKLNKDLTIIVEGGENYQLGSFEVEKIHIKEGDILNLLNWAENKKNILVWIEEECLKQL
jgi:hypothetical protein